MIGVLVVDDSPTARQLIVETLSGDPEFRIVGEARDGVEGVELTQKLRPQVVTMDLHMPRLDGFGATREIMARTPTPVVIVTSTLRSRDVGVALEALRAGALAVLHRPNGPAAPNFADDTAKLCSTVKAMSQVKVVRQWNQVLPRTVSGITNLRPATPAVGATCSTLVAVATSTGGPAALQNLLAGLPGNFPAPVLVVQHITAGFVPGLATWLGSSTALRVKVAEQSEILALGTVYLAPDGRHLGVVAPSRILLSEGPPVGGFRPSGTPLFESAARVFGARTVAVILTGMGEDGVVGLRAVRQAGGRVLAQDEASCVVYGMPGAAVQQGLADLVLPIDGMAAKLIELLGERTTARR